MSYDIHIVRTASWVDATKDPIAKHQVDALIASDSELAWSADDRQDMSDDHGVVTPYFSILWKDDPCFWWYINEITCSRPTKGQLAKMVQIARQLHANVIGDDGEMYP